MQEFYVGGRVLRGIVTLLALARRPAVA